MENRRKVKEEDMGEGDRMEAETDETKKNKCKVKLGACVKLYVVGNESI